MIRVLQQEIKGTGLVDSNVISSWRFEDNALDSIGNNNFQTGYSGTGYYVDYIVGKGKDLNASNTWLKVANNQSLGFSDGANDVAGSFSFFMQPQYASIPLSNTPYILCKRGNMTTTNREYQLAIVPDGRMFFNLFDKDLGNVDGSKLQVYYDLSAGYVQYKNYHVIITYDGSGTPEGLKMYIDGIDVGTSLEIGTYTKCFNYNVSLYVGTVSWSENNAVHRPAITINELKKLSVALSAADAFTLYTEEMSGNRIVG